MEEIIICEYCKSEYSLYYEDDQVVAATKCRCEDTNKIKVLDLITKELDKQFKRGERK